MARSCGRSNRSCLASSAITSEQQAAPTAPQAVPVVGEAPTGGYCRRSPPQRLAVVLLIVGWQVANRQCADESGLANAVCVIQRLD